MALSKAVKEQLHEVRVTPAEWACRWFGTPTWYGDTCLDTLLNELPRPAYGRYVETS